MMLQHTTRTRIIQAAPGMHRCCDEPGRLANLAQHWRPHDELVALAVALGEGTREQVTARIRDMLAGGMLIELEGN